MLANYRADVSHDSDAAGLRRWLAAEVDVGFVDASIERIGTGHSRAMYVVTATSGRRAVARVEQGGVFGTTSAEECRVMQSLHACGYPVARIIAADLDGHAVGRPMFVMEFVDGAVGPDAAVIDDATAVSFVRSLRELHQLDGRHFGFDIVPTCASDATPMQIQRWHRVHDMATPLPDPLIDEAAAWLLHHAPALSRLAVVHGDAGPGNFVHDRGRVVAVTDWEFAHLGDPAEDFAYCLTMRGPRTMPRQRWLRLFADHAGVEMTDAQWRYWEAFNLFKGACANRTCLTIFEGGRNRAPNMAIIGTALHHVFLRRLAAIVHDTHTTTHPTTTHTTTLPTKGTRS